MKRLPQLITLMLVAVIAFAVPSGAADEPTGSIVGIVRGDPESVAGAKVALWSGRYEEQVSRTEVVAPSGSYRFEDVAAGTYYVLVFNEGSVMTPASLNSRFGESGPVSVVAGYNATAPTQYIYKQENVGHIAIDSIDTRLGYSIWSVDDPEGPRIPRSAAVHNDFVDYPLAPGQYKIRTEIDDWIGGRSFHSAKVYTVRPGETLTVRPPPPNGGNIDGGVGLEGVRITAYAADDPTEVIREDTSDDDGHFYLHRLDHGTKYKLRAVDPSGRLRAAWLGGTNFHTASAVAPSSSSTDPTYYIPMDRLDGATPYEPPAGNPEHGSIEGTAFGPGLHPDRNGIRLVDARTGDALNGERGVAYWSVDDHRFAIDDIPPGDYKMLVNSGVWVGGRSLESAKVFRVESGKVLREDIEIPLAGRVQTRVLNHYGSPIRGIMVEARTATGADEIVDRAFTSDDGTIIFPRLGIHPYRFRVVDASGRFGDTWIGGGTSYESAPSFTPKPGDHFSPSHLPDVYPRPLMHPLTAPQIGGTAAYGNALEAKSVGTWSMWGQGSRQWLRDGAPIRGETGPSYRLKTTDIGRKISFQITAKKTGHPTRTAESRVVSIKRAKGSMTLKHDKRGRWSVFRVKVRADKISPSKIWGTVIVRSKSGTRVVKAKLHNGSARVSLRAFRGGRNPLVITVSGPSWLEKPTTSGTFTVK